MMPKMKQSTRCVKRIAVDILMISALITLLVGITRLWRPFERGFFCGDQSLMYPYHEDTVSVFMLRVITVAVPCVVFVIYEYAYLRTATSLDVQFLRVTVPAWLRGLYCALASYALGYLFVEITANMAKNVIGRPRPNFFDVCKPSIDCDAPEWQNRYIQSSDYHCTGQGSAHLLQDTRKSFLSGHSAITAFAMVYVALYLESRMQWRGMRFLRHTLQFLAIMASWFTALSRVTDYKHHWSDVLAGYSMGFIVAVVTWLWTTNLISRDQKHVPLPQHDVVLPTCQQSTPPAPLYEVAIGNNQQVAAPTTQ
ncbi:unnamed protein product [Plutella xylostella]|uniref:(diamondback moth) hypothetical protein n=1 Tax=Plutella xylostella TaxID=51655 RepID=A0A8S4FZD1_PLUXY|nr:unnamed protein product [Plutella xylostella]